MLADRILCSSPEMARALIRALMYERGAAIVSDTCVDVIFAEIRERGMAAEVLKAHGVHAN